ncbi:uncharacterized protein LOC115750528 [Rhodamnia argentea]|uniref:Uncharacterized protein LOC115750528 n=1 Tax=Rhodamnia argentea TaxID=178133 RepID=A0A8B8Q9M5_9MYRT|nr:uncharacterized protein LOC115750528 [Rhodamnia argentea]
MADYESRHHHQQQQAKETALQALNTIIQLHFEKTLEKKRAIDQQKKELHRLFLLFFIFLALLFNAVSQPSSRLQCRHCWAPISLLSLSHLVFYVSVAQTLRTINGFKYQRRCHKLTLGLATERLRELRMRMSVAMANSDGAPHPHHHHHHHHHEVVFDDEDFEIQYQEPPESYLGKFKRNWALHFGFLILVYGFMVSFSVVILCF